MTRILFALTALLLACTTRAIARDDRDASVTPRECGRARVGEPAPWLAGWTLEDRVVNLEHLKQQAASQGRRSILIVFFATWCAPCKPGLRLLAQHLATLPDAGVHLVLVDYQEEAAQVRPFLSSMGLDGVPVILDRFGKAAQAYGAARHLGDDQWEGTLPRTFLLDTSGVVRLIVTEEGRDYLDLILRASRSAPSSGQRQDPR